MSSGYSWAKLRPLLVYMGTLLFLSLLALILFLIISGCEMPHPNVYDHTFYDGTRITAVKYGEEYKVMVQTDDSHKYWGVATNDPTN